MRVLIAMNQHRRRDLHDRFLRTGVAGFLDHESVELLLTVLFPPEEIDRIAENLRLKFGRLRDILDAPLTELEAVDGVGAAGAIALRIVRDTASLSVSEAI